ncbi:hypothetical protein [Abyssibius alkaniclasticus]|uniref:hypothetical protein n=1 Tax=Abyssibius alkaniclasticus TaxID=2881234 RepID=UPI00405A4BAA|tara:strand:+ start:41 stop:226 length:186 start_codon:yes stop_codon:yes gene_type:complete
MNFLKKFSRDDAGAVTVDWVVLTATMVVMGVGVIAIFAPGANSSANEVSSAITDTVSTLMN